MISLMHGVAMKTSKSCLYITVVNLIQLCAFVVEITVSEDYKLGTNR